MRLLSYKRGSDASTFGVVRGDGVINGEKLLDGQATSLREALELGLIDDLERLSDGREADSSLREVEFLPPIPDPAKILCVGVNYADHRSETGHVDTPDYPTIFTRFADTQVGHLQPVVHPATTTQLDYEGEVAIIIGRPTTAVTSDAEALGAIAGLACYNDLSARDWQLHNSQWTPGKNFRGVGAFGPWLTTLDEVNDLASVRLRTRVNGEVRQDATLEQLIFNFTAILRYITGFTDLAPGDIVATGTPGGVGLVADPPSFLSPGDVVEVEVSGVGLLRNEIAAAEGQ